MYRKGVFLGNESCAGKEKTYRSGEARHTVILTYNKRYDFFDRFRSFSSTAIDRGIGIGRIGVEKTTFAISLGKRIANTMIFSNVFDRFNRRRKTTLDFVKNIGRSSKTLFGLHKLRCVVGSFSSTAIVFEHRDRSSHQHRSIRRRKIDVRFL